MLSKYVSIFRIRNSILGLQAWRSKVDSQGAKHLMHFLAAKKGGVNKGSFVNYEEDDDYKFCDDALKVRPGKNPYYDPLDGEFRIESHPHSNIATARNKTFRDAWRAAETKKDSDGNPQWKFSENYLEIISDKVLTKARITTKVPIYDLCAWLYRTREFSDCNSLGDVINTFKSEYNLSPEEYNTIFTTDNENNTKESPGAFFARSKASDEALLELFNNVMNYDVSDAISKISPNGDKSRITVDDIATLLKLGKKQIALQGPPGTGKTFVAKKVAKNILNTLDNAADQNASDDLYINLSTSLEALVQRYKDSGGWTIVQFHPSYTYEDFVRGLAPKIDSSGHMPSFEVQDRVFARACTVANLIKPKPFILIIDEINRGDLSKVLGELLYALEYRDEPVSLQYSKDGEAAFSVPSNLYLIATLNTADKSIANIDYAIRRRFDFVTIAPDRSVIRDSFADGSLRDSALALFDAVAELLQDHPNYALGHSYFMGKTPESLAHNIVFQVLPILAEYRAEGILGDVDSLHVPGWLGSSGIPLTHERPFDLAKIIEQWINQHGAPENGEQ